MANTVLTTIAADRYCSAMVTRVYSNSRRRLFLKEHREAKHVSADAMAVKLGIERESVYRLEREALTRLSAGKQAAYAIALDIEPEALWRPPGGPPSLDAMVASSPDDIKLMAADIVRRLVKGLG